jgi:hypothetical protein
MEAQGRERMYSSYSFTTSALDGGEWSASRPGRALAPEKGPPVPIVQETRWVSEPVWTQRLEEKSFVSAGDRTPIARSSSPYSDTILTELPGSHNLTVHYSNMKTFLSETARISLKFIWKKRRNILAVDIIIRLILPSKKNFSYIRTGLRENLFVFWRTGKATQKLQLRLKC